MHIGDRIKRLRDKKDWTQAELAERSGVLQSLISRLEGHTRDNPGAKVLRGLARALGCTTDYLVGMHEDDESEGMPTALTTAGAAI